MRSAVIEVFLLLGVATISFTQSLSQRHRQLFDEGLSDYVGSLGGAVVHMTLVSDGGKEIQGSYFYKCHPKDIPVRGEYINPRDILLNEYDAQNRVIATFRLRAPEHDPKISSRELLQGEVLMGTWTSTGNKRSLAVYLDLVDILSGVKDLNHRYASAGASSDSEVEKNVQAFYYAILKGDKQRASNYARYPLSVFSRDSKPRTIRNKVQFLKDFEETFTLEDVECLAQTTPHDMFANYQGVMLGNGMVWFDATGYAVTLNPCVSDGKKQMRNPTR